MIIKSGDDQSKRIRLLEELQLSPLLDSFQKDWLVKQLKMLRSGQAGERDAAHYINSYWGDGENSAVIHDLRLDIDGQVAQIDHLIISRAFTFYLLETKNFAGNLSINEYGEFSVSYDSGKTFGIESPIEQSRRHELVLRKALDQLGITGRVSKMPAFEHVVMIHPKGIIKRPDPKKFDTKNVIKADQIRTWHDGYVDNELSAIQVFSGLFNLRGKETVRDWAERLVAMHRPVDPLWLPDFMAPKIASKSAPATQSGAVQSEVHLNRPGIPAAQADALKKKCICATCGQKISFEEAKFCWRQERRFGGLQYCREHQKSHS